MNNYMKVIDILLDKLKKVLVRFKNAKFGLLFLINIFKIPDFITDKRVNIISKFRVGFSFATAMLYIISGIDFIPEMITGVFGFFDDLFVMIWCLGIVSEEIEKYKKLIKDDEDDNIIKNVKFEIKDE
ncbi:MAG: YkvA family protein [Romboutsia sp.]|uniref:YkvA family protein n=1 Tax=Romboutsia sp. TaxID=1965302 RepID=UPI003F383C32